MNKVLCKQLLSKSRNLEEQELEILAGFQVRCFLQFYVCTIAGLFLAVCLQKSEGLDSSQVQSPTPHNSTQNQIIMGTLSKSLSPFHDLTGLESRLMPSGAHAWSSLSTLPAIHAHSSVQQQCRTRRPFHFLPPYNPTPATIKEVTPSVHGQGTVRVHTLQNFQNKAYMKKCSDPLT